MVDEKVFGDMLDYISQYSEYLEQKRGLSKQDYLNDIDTQLAVERALQNLVQASIDLAQHIRSSEDLSPSGTGKKEMQALYEAGIISNETREAMADAVAFRNILAHRYGEVNNEIVYSVHHNDLHHFKQFQQETSYWFEQHALKDEE